MKNLRRNWFPLTFAFIFILSSCNEQHSIDKAATPVVAPEQIVSVKDAKLMYDTYSSRRKPLIRHYEDSINARNGNDKMKQNTKSNPTNKAAIKVDSFPVARYVYYDYQTIKNYLSYIEEEAKNKGIEIATLRFYFSNYPENMPVTNAKPKQNSIFIMPTISQDNRTFGYFLNDKEQLTLLNDDLRLSKTRFKPDSKNSKMKASFLPEFESLSIKPSYTLFQGSKSYILNEGGVRPPPYGQ